VTPGLSGVSVGLWAKCHKRKGRKGSGFAG